MKSQIATSNIPILHNLLERLGSMQIHTIEELLEFAKNAAHIQTKNYWGLSSI